MKNQRIIIKIFVTFLLIMVLFMVFLLSKSKNPFIPIVINNEIQFETVDKRRLLNVNKKGDYVIKNSSEWDILWNEIYFNTVVKPELPKINFDKHMVIAIFNGIEKVKGFNVEITKVEEINDIVYVFIKKIIPGAFCEINKSFYNSYHIVGFEKKDKKIQYIEKKETADCKQE